jgi:PAS domain S-box-containing protein
MNYNNIIPVLDILNKFASRSTDIRNVSDLAIEVDHILEELIGMEYNGLFLYDFVEKKLKLYYAKGFSEEERLEAERTALDRHPGYVFKTGKMMYVRDTEEYNPAENIDSKRSFKIRSRLSIPVLNGDTVVGVFVMGSSEKNKFSEKQIAVFSFIGNIAGSVYGQILSRSELQENAKQTRLIIDTALDAYVLINSKGVVIRWNKQAILMFGYTVKEAIGKKISDLIIPSSMQKLHIDGMKRYKEPGLGPVVNKRIEVQARRKSGKQFLVELAVNAVRIGNDNFFSAFIKDISEQKQSQDELELTTSRISTLIRNLHTGILVEDEKRKIVLVNNEYCRLFNIAVDPEKLVGLDCNSIFHRASRFFKDPDNFLDRTDTILTLLQPAIDEQLDLLDGRVYERDYLPIYSGVKFMGNLWRYSDITARKNAEQELKSARQEAISANIAKSQFLANMSHEIRTPLHAISGLTRLLEDTPVTEEQKKLISGLNSSSEGLLGIVNDILDFSKIEAGQMELNETEFSLDDLVKKVFDAFEYRAEEKELKLKLIYDESLRFSIHGDNIRLRQVLVNLMSNAIKFTQKGQVTVEIRMIKSTKNTCTVKFKVSDTGIGIADDNIKRIFQSFQQVDTGTTRNYGGTGLGLPISRQLVELMGGKLEVKSEKGKGSEFFFTLIFKKTINITLPDEQAPTESTTIGLEGISVLIVEDNQFNQFIAKSTLEKWRMVVEVANNGKEALEKLKANSFQIVLMDLQMPEMGGLEATRKIRMELKLDIPIIALTANAVKGVIDECISAGMNDYIPKPFKPEVLAKKIKDLTDKND